MRRGGIMWGSVERGVWFAEMLIRLWNAHSSLEEEQESCACMMNSGWYCVTTTP
jgi:hypothetical protein